MLFLYPFLRNHSANKLNQHLIFFFRQLRKVSRTSSFLPYNTYFHPDFVLHLDNSPTLVEKFQSFFNAFRNLSATNKGIVIKCFFDCQSISKIIEDELFDASHLKISAMPASIRKSIKELFAHMYPSTLNSIGNLSDHWQQIYGEIFGVRKLKVCPFCSIEPLYPPKIRRQDYDHILKQETYPFASLNMKNLVPMGRDCNQIFKGRKDSIYDGATRRAFANPYKTFANISIDLNGSILPNRTTAAYGNWSITLSPANKFTSTWDQVFDIKKRYSETMLMRYFDDWLGYFIDVKKRNNVVITTHQQLIAHLNDEADLFSKQPLIEAHIIKSALFTYLAACGDAIYYNTILAQLNS